MGGDAAVEVDTEQVRASQTSAGISKVNPTLQTVLWSILVTLVTKNFLHVCYMRVSSLVLFWIGTIFI